MFRFGKAVAIAIARPGAAGIAQMGEMNAMAEFLNEAHRVKIPGHTQ